MGTEIERKFLVINDAWRAGAQGVAYRQGYLAVGPPVAVRARVKGDTAVLTVKKSTPDIVRDEFEYPIPVADAEQMLDGLCTGAVIEKTRYTIPYGGLTWEVDEFHSANQGLVIAEVELAAVDQPYEKPPWAGAEVSGDPRYFNAGLAQHPYCRW